MTNLPPLPLVDGALLLDNSTLEILQTCPRAMQYSYLQKRIAASDRPALNFGSAVHSALAERYRLGTDRLTSDQHVQVLDKLDQHFFDNPAADGDFRTLSLARLLVDRYLSVWPNEPFRIVQGKVEASFALPLGYVGYQTPGTEPITVPVFWTGRIDAIVENNEGIWCLDHKTSSIFGDSFWQDMAMSAQFLGYVWACQQSLGTMPRGYIINGIRTRRPTKMDDYDEEKGVRADDFSRQSFYVGEDQITEWKQNTLALVREFLWHHANDYMPRKTKWCIGKYGRCQYYNVCSLPTTQRAQYLASSEFEDQTWSPLNQATKPK